MASRQRARAPKKERNPNQLVDLGIFEIPDVDAMVEDDSVEDESELESELEAILSGKTGAKSARPKKKVTVPLDIERLAADCLKDVPDNSEDDDESLDDPDLLNELKGLTLEEDTIKEGEIEGDNMTEKLSERAESSQKSLVPLLNDRLELYNQALSSAKTLNDANKVRRFSRGIKTLENLIKSAKAGKDINENDIPPVVSIPKETHPKQKVLVEEPSHKSNESSKIPTTNILDNLFVVEKEEKVTPERGDEHAEYFKILHSRRQKYKMAALEAKKAGDKVTALEHMKILKKFDALIETNEKIDITLVPPSPTSCHKVSPPEPSMMEHGETQTSSIEAAALSAASEPEDPTLFSAPPAPNSVLEALEQRLEKFSSTLSAAKAEGNVSKSRRLERIVKSYEKACHLYKAGKPVDFEALPTPPGFAPIPIPTPQSSAVPPSSSKMEKPVKKPVGEEGTVLPPKRQAPEVPSKNVQPQKPKVGKTSTSLGNKQLEFLLERQRLFREAAITAKKNGNIDEAKEWLRMSKGFDSMCEAVKCGLPVDMSQIPTPPQLAISENDFEIVDRFECDAESDFEFYEILHKDLAKQIEMCKNNKEHFLKLGDVSAASKFEKLYLESQKDLSIIFHLKKLGKPPPKFHYETRMFTIVQCNSHLTDEQLELRIERGINLPGKSDQLDSYIKIEFPIMQDAPQKAKTNVIRDTNNPIFQEEFKFTFNRKSRTQLRQFKRQALKLEVFSKGGFLRADVLLGTVSIKLVDLESVCTIYKCFDLMDGRKIAGGQLECKVRIRQPLLTKQIEQVKEKWLVVES